MAHQEPTPSPGKSHDAVASQQQHDGGHSEVENCLASPSPSFDSVTANDCTNPLERRRSTAGRSPEKASGSVDPMTTMSVLHDCFNPYSQPRGHFHSANRLFERGVWVGFLDKSRHNESFRGLPSFHDLKMNYSRLSAPHPPVVHGVADEERLAVCRGCAGIDSLVISLCEIQFAHNTKIMIMPLAGDDDVGTFCIMLSENLPRSLRGSPYLKGLYGYRPYEITGDGLGTNPTSTFMLLTLRSPRQDGATLKTVLHWLSPSELSSIQHRMATRSTLDLPSDLPSIPTGGTAQRETEPPTRRTTATNAEIGDRSVDNSMFQALPESNKRKRRKSQAASSRRRSKVAKESGDPSMHQSSSASLGADSSDAPKSPRSSILESFKRPMLPSLSASHPQVQSAPDQTKAVSGDLTEAQAKRIHFVWTIIDHDGTACDLVHTLHECKTFQGLLILFQEEVCAFPSAAAILMATKMWRLTYSVANGAKRAVVAHTATETVFDRLQTTLAHLPLWNVDTNATIDVEIKVLSKLLDVPPTI